MGLAQSFPSPPKQMAKLSWEIRAFPAPCQRRQKEREMSGDCLQARIHHSLVLKDSLQQGLAVGIV